MTRAAAAEEVRKPLVFANLMVRMGDAEGSVAGAVHTTADVVRTAIQVIGTDPSFKLVSSFFLMMLCEPFHSLKGGLIFSDCGLVVDPNAEELSEIAMAAADSARNLLGEEPRVAMLSFSTSRSAKHAAVDKVVAAAERVKELRPGLAIDGDVQLDAAIVAEIANRKLPASQVKGALTRSSSPTSRPATSATSWPSVSAARSPSDRCCRAWPSRPTTCRAAAAPRTCSTSSR